MLGTDIALKHQVVQHVYEDLLREAAKQRAANEAYAARPRSRSKAVANVRAFVASALLRAGSWLMPEEDCLNPGGHGLELRPGR
jgi:hypothetical protein